MRRRGDVPFGVAVPAAVGLSFLLIPLLVLVAQSPWRRLPHLLGEQRTMDALRLSLLCASAATVASVLLGVPVAILLARSRSRWVSTLRALVLLPLVLPPVVAGVALLGTLGRTGVIGRPLDRAFGVTLPFSTTAVVLAEAFVAMPFLILTVEGALRGADRRFDEAAATLGASRHQVLRRVTLPSVAPSLLAGSVLAWSRALGEFGATITFAGNFPGHTQTLPLAVYLALETDPDAAYALSFVLLLVCVATLVLLRDRWFRNPNS